MSINSDSSAIDASHRTALSPSASPLDKKIDHVHSSVMDNTPVHAASANITDTVTATAGQSTSSSPSLPVFDTTTRASGSTPASGSGLASDSAPAPDSTPASKPKYGTVLVPDSDTPGSSTVRPSNKRKKKPGNRTASLVPAAGDDSDDSAGGPGRKPAFNKWALAFIRTPSHLETFTSIYAIKDANVQKGVRSTFLDGLVTLLGDMVNYEWDSIKYGGSTERKAAAPLNTLTTAQQASEKPRRQIFAKFVKGVCAVSFFLSPPF
jgi:hypothetical protein